MKEKFNCADGTSVLIQSAFIGMPLNGFGVIGMSTNNTEGIILFIPTSKSNQVLNLLKA